MPQILTYSHEFTDYVQSEVNRNMPDTCNFQDVSQLEDLMDIQVGATFTLLFMPLCIYFLEPFSLYYLGRKPDDRRMFLPFF